MSIGGELRPERNINQSGPRPMRVLLKSSHGLGDNVQLSCVLQHLAKHRPDWQIDVASQIGKHSVFHGQCRKSWILGREPIPEYEYQVFNLGWYECYSVYSDSPCTKVCNCLREVFGIAPEMPLLKYRIQVGDEAREVTRRYLQDICETAFGASAVAEVARLQPASALLNSGAILNCGQFSYEARPNSHEFRYRPNSGEFDCGKGRFPVVAIHYEGNTSAHKKNLAQRQVAPLCRELLLHGYTPLILDWDRRSSLPDQKTIFCPGVGPGDVWDNIGTGDAERLAALIGQCALFIGVDSGPLHVAGATDTPTLGVWKAHSPLQFYDLCSNVTHLVPEDWRTVPPCQQAHAAKFFAEHYAYRTYRPAALESSLIDMALEMLAAGHPDIRAPPLKNGVGTDGLTARRSPIQIRNPRVSIDRAQIRIHSLKEPPMTTAAAVTWQQIPGLAHEIALGADGAAWCLGMGDMPSGGGYSIHRWNGFDWDHVDGAAVKIAVGPAGEIWAVARDHSVLRNSPAGWEALPGLAREIAVGANGAVWCISASDFAPGGGSIHAWNGRDWEHADGGAAVKLAVGPDGNPWIVNSAGQIFRRSGEGWELLPGLARAIAIGADGSVWCLCATQNPAVDSSVHYWNGFDWEHIPGAAVKIAAGLPGTVLLVNAQHQIFRAVQSDQSPALLDSCC